MANSESIRCQISEYASSFKEKQKQILLKHFLTGVNVVACGQRAMIKISVQQVSSKDISFPLLADDQFTEHETLSLDEVLKDEKQIDIIQIEAKGYEPLIFDGMQQLLAKNPDITIYIIFDPYYLQKAGVDPRAFVHQLLKQGFSVAKIDRLSTKISPLSEKDLLTDNSVNLILKKVTRASNSSPYSSPLKSSSPLDLLNIAALFKIIPEISHKPIRFQIEGTFDNSYSLSIVNRELALALDRQEPGKVALFATDGQTDYQPNQDFIQKIEGLEQLWKRGKKKSGAEVVIRYLFPPCLADMDGSINLCYFAWEESHIPAELVEIFNRYVDGFLVPANFVKQVLINSGVYKPVKVTGHGIEQVLREEPKTYQGNLGKSFRFLHISSGFARKGLDVLLQAYTQAFTSNEDVSLVIKTSHNIHNTVQEQIHLLRKTRAYCPDIVLITDDLPTGYITNIYQRCHALVAPSRGEGFGLPMAEAMLFNLPVITTEFGGQADFCTEKTAWLIDYSFAKSKSHLSTDSSVWVEPDANHLAKLMQEVYQATQEQLQVKTQAAKKLIEQKFVWDVCASRVREFVEEIKAIKSVNPRKINMGWVTSWNTKCGIAGYSNYFINGILSTSSKFNLKILANRTDVTVKPDENNVNRCWDSEVVDPDISELKAAVEELDIVVIQHQNSLIKDSTLAQLIVFLHEKGIKTIVIFHSLEEQYIEPLTQQFALADRLLVHRLADLNRLKNLGLVNNVSLLTHGVMYRPKEDSTELKKQLDLLDKKLIASYGFLFPHKGIEQLIEAFAKIKATHPDTFLLLANSFHTNPVTKEIGEKCKNLISHLGLDDSVLMINDFLEEEESLRLLNCADLIVFPHQYTGESSSASVRFGLTSNQPVACTPLNIFDDVKDLVHFLPGTSPNDLATGIIDLFTNPATMKTKHEIQQRWLKENSWEAIATRFSGMVQAIVNDHEG
ncbi:glycosyltransferase [Microcoleus sp. PH2017_30_WIL_O_A]|uniref:glycosyltransferase n=1 Tax=Microcoleus sp. PH2017_30_WIL_O_A TaxID=2798840 RepID=UPI0025DCC79F|nr:glycosyltransferase [Microcoleus sp. PH2017_30_WIL_O_A]